MARLAGGGGILNALAGERQDGGPSPHHVCGRRNAQSHGTGAGMDPEPVPLSYECGAADGAPTGDLRGRVSSPGPRQEEDTMAIDAANIDEAKLEAFMGQAVTDMGAIISAPLFLIGEKLGLYKAMAGAGPLTSQEVAERAGVAERNVREWLRNQAAGGYVTYDAGSDRYTLPDEQALALADEESPFYILGVYESIASIYADEERIVEAF